MKYSQHGNTIEGQPQYDQASPNRARLWARNTGMGIPTGNLPSLCLFSPTATFDRSRSGWGIGLTLTHELVIQHDSSIWAESQEGAGSTFSVELPRPSPETRSKCVE